MLALAANVASVLLLLRYKDGDASAFGLAVLPQRRDWQRRRVGSRARGVEHHFGLARPAGGRNHGGAIPGVVDPDPATGLAGISGRSADGVTGMNVKAIVYALTSAALFGPRHSRQGVVRESAVRVLRICFSPLGQGER